MTKRSTSKLDTDTESRDKVNIYIVYTLCIWLEAQNA